MGIASHTLANGVKSRLLLPAVDKNLRRLRACVIMPSGA
jgi:hypothetical protein